MILESPALPVAAGASVILRCKAEMNTSNRKYNFYKDDLSIGSSLMGEMTIHNASKSDEGLYKCSVPGGGESVGSWLAVEGEMNSSYLLFANSSSCFCNIRIHLSSQLLFHLRRLWLQLQLPVQVPAPDFCATWWSGLHTCCPPSYWDSYTETGREVGTRRQPCFYQLTLANQIKLLITKQCG